MSALMIALACGVVGLLVWGQIAHGPAPPFILLIAGLMLITLAAWWSGSGPYRIGGGAGELRVYHDHLEVPGVRRGTVVRLPRADLVIERSPVHVQLRYGWIPLATLRRGELLTLRSGDAIRVLSTLTSPALDFADRLLLSLISEEDALALERLLDGRTHAAEAPDELDRRIDEELAQLDD